MHPLALLLPAFVCAAACWFFAAEAAAELRAWRARLNRDRGPVAGLAALAFLCLAGSAVALVPPATFAVDAAIALGLLR